MLTPLTISTAALYQVLEECSLYTCDQAQRDSMRSTQPAMIDASIGISKGGNPTHFSASQVDPALAYF